MRWLEQRGWSTECCQSCALCAYLCPSVSIVVSDSSVKQTRLSSGVLEEATEKRRGNTVRTLAYLAVQSHMSLGLKLRGKAYTSAIGTARKDMK